MKVRLLKPYGLSAAGDVLPDVAGPVAELLIARGVAEPCDPPAKMVAAPPADKMLRVHQARRKGGR